MNSMTMITGSFRPNATIKFSSRSTSTSTLFLPVLTERGSLLIPPNSKNRHIAYSRYSNLVLSEDESREEKTLSPFDFKAYMLEKQNAVNQALDAAVPLREPTKIHEAMRYSLLPTGKRMSPIICIASCELVGGTESTAMAAACAVEMMCTMYFMLDDLPCMDNSDFRRKVPANHKVFGEYMTILAGVSLEALAFEHIARDAIAKNMSSQNVLRVISELARLMGAEGIAAGQAADLEIEGKSGIRLDQVEYIHLHKAAPFYESAAISGAILGGASEEEVNRLRNYAKFAGLLFQAVDDIADVNKDLLAGKATYPTLIGVDKARELTQQLLRKAQDQLDGFDPEKAAPLKALVEFIYNKQN